MAWSLACAATISRWTPASTSFASARVRPKSAMSTRPSGRLISTTSAHDPSPSAPISTSLKTQATYPPSVRERARKYPTAVVPPISRRSPWRDARLTSKYSCEPGWPGPKVDRTGFTAVFPALGKRLHECLPDLTFSKPIWRTTLIMESGCKYPISNHPVAGSHATVGLIGDLRGPVITPAGAAVQHRVLLRRRVGLFG